jgi:hypothetical protein
MRDLLPAVLVTLVVLLMVVSATPAKVGDSTIAPPFQTLYAPTPPSPVTLDGVNHTIDTMNFWGANGQIGNVTPTHRVTRLVKETPLSVFRFGSGMDNTNLTEGITYRTSGAHTPATNDLAEDWKFCESLTPKCTFIMQLPGETDSVGDITAAILYLHSQGIYPQYFAIGNEPEGWIHFGIPWTSWHAKDRSTPTPIQYAQEVQTMIPTIRSLAPGAKIIGVESQNCDNNSYIQEVALIDGPDITAIACHKYPADSEVNSTAGVQQFYNSLESNKSSVTVGAAGAKEAETYLCHTAKCADLPVWLDEFNGVSTNELVHPQFGEYMTGYPDAVLLAGSIIEALSGGLQQFLDYALWAPGNSSSRLASYGLLNNTDAEVRPSYDFYSYFASRMASGQNASVYVTNYTPSVMPGYAVYVTNATSGAFLLVNANNTQSQTVRLPPRLGYLYHGQSVYWNGTTTSPVVSVYAHVPRIYTLGPHSILLVSLAHARDSSTYRTGPLAGAATSLSKKHDHWFDMTATPVMRGVSGTVIAITGSRRLLDAFDMSVLRRLEHVERVGPLSMLRIERRGAVCAPQGSL